MDMRPWARLVRIPNVFTVLADVSAAFLLVGHDLEGWPRWILVLLAGVCLYWAGMIFNDLFDLEEDRRLRPTRPLPSGAISLVAAWRAGAALMVLGIGLAAAAGFVPVEGMETSWRPAMVAGLLAVAILAYDGPLKPTPVAPLVMGLCRSLSFLLGASPVLRGEMPATIFPSLVWAASAGFGVYVTGITVMARREAEGSSRRMLGAGLGILVVGALLMAVSPRFAGAEELVPLRRSDQFGWLIGLISATVVWRASQAWWEPTPRRIQVAIKSALLALIPLAAAFAWLGAGVEYAAPVLLLMLPAVGLAAKFRMT